MTDIAAPITDEQVRSLASLIVDARSVVAFTGAGISTESGIPDFRGPQGLWKTVDPNEYHIENYVRSAEHRARVWQRRLAMAERDVEPNDGHRALSDLQRLGLLDSIITQNIDGLHQTAGSGRVIELHGHTREVVCLSCEERFPAAHAYERLRAGETDLHCRSCGGLLKSATVSFGQPLPGDVIDEAVARARSCGLCLVIGSSLVVYPAAAIPVEALRAGARLAIVNAEPTPFDEYASIVVNASAGSVLRRTVEQVRSLLGG